MKKKTFPFHLTTSKIQILFQLVLCPCLKLRCEGLNWWYAEPLLINRAKIWKMKEILLNTQIHVLQQIEVT